MDDPSQYPDAEQYTTPRWVKVSAIIGLVVVVLFLVVLVVHGPHRPGQHFHGGRTQPVQQKTQP